MRTILFDWDGTIVDSIQALFETDGAICRQIGVPFDESIFRRAFSPNWRLMYRSLGIPEERVDEAVLVWASTFHADRTRPFPGIEDALGRLVGAGFTLGIVTGGSRAEVEPQLARLSIDGLLTVRVYGHDTTGVGDGRRLSPGGGRLRGGRARRHADGRGSRGPRRRDRLHARHGGGTHRRGRS